MESGIDIQNLILQANSYMNYSHELLKKKNNNNNNKNLLLDNISVEWHLYQDSLHH